MNNLAEVVATFNKNGIAVVEKFASEAECDAMIDSMKTIVANMNAKEHSK